MPTVFMAALALGGCTRSVPKAQPGGIYASTSAGANFDQSVRIEGEEGQYVARFTLYDIFRVPLAPENIYIGAGSNGVIRSENGGESWIVIDTPLASTLDVVLLDDGTLVVAGVDSAGQGRVLRSLDDGLSWQQVFTIPVPTDEKPNFLLGSDPIPSVVMSIALDPFNQNRIYAASTLGTVFVGEQSAKVWRAYHTVSNPRTPPVGNQNSAGILKMVPSPHVPDELLVITQARELIRIRGGVQEEISVPDRINDPTPIGRIAGEKDVYDIAFIPQFPDALLLGVEDGAVVTRDSGLTWLQLEVPVEPTLEFKSIQVTVSPTNPDRIFTTINNVVYRSEDGGLTWNTFSFNLQDFVITGVSINPANASRVLVVLQPLRT